MMSAGRSLGSLRQSKPRSWLVTLAIVVLGSAFASRSAAAAEDSGLGEALAKNKLHVLALTHEAPANQAVTKWRNVGMVRIAVGCQKVLSQPRVQAAAESIRLAIEAWGLKRLAGVRIDFFGPWVTKPPSGFNSSHGGAGIYWAESVAEGLKGEKLTALSVSGDSLATPAQYRPRWYASSVCHRPFRIERTKEGYSLHGMDAWARVDSWCAAYAKRPKSGTNVIARATLVESVIQPAPPSAATAGLVPHEGEVIRVSSWTTEVSGVPITRVTVEFQTTDKPLSRKEILAIGKSLRMRMERWPNQGMGLVAFVAQEGQRAVTSTNALFIGSLFFWHDRDYGKAERYDLLAGGMPDGAKPVAWYGATVWHRTIEYRRKKKGRAVRFQRALDWKELAWWVSGNAMPPTDPATISLHAPKLIRGRLPKFRRGR